MKNNDQSHIKKLTYQDIMEAYERISEFVVKTNIISDENLNAALDNKVFFKLENLQKTGSFKIRGAFNHIIKLKELNQLPPKIVGVTSGNHGAALSYICGKFNLECLIYTSKITSSHKIKAMKNFGANVIVTEDRATANKLAEDKIKDGYHFIHPSSDDMVIAGQGTIMMEAIQQIGNVDSIFAACGGGGLVSGLHIASKACENDIRVFAVEPKTANDAQLSIKNNKIFTFRDSPQTMADGARTLAISKNTFKYLKEIEDILTVNEEDIQFWTEKLNKTLTGNIEPTAAMTMAACRNWIKDNNIKDQRILIVISGGNYINNDI